MNTRASIVDNGAGGRKRVNGKRWSKIARLRNGTETIFGNSLQDHIQNAKMVQPNRSARRQSALPCHGCKNCEIRIMSVGYSQMGEQLRSRFVVGRPLAVIVFHLVIGYMLTDRHRVRGWSIVPTNFAFFVVPVRRGIPINEIKCVWNQEQWDWSRNLIIEKQNKSKKSKKRYFLVSFAAHFPQPTTATINFCDYHYSSMRSASEVTIKIAGK